MRNSLPRRDIFTAHRVLPSLVRAGAACEAWRMAFPTAVPRAAAPTAGVRTLARDRARPVLSCRGLRASIDGQVMVDDLHFDVGAGEAYGLVGAEGVGKTAVVLAVCGLL